MTKKVFVVRWAAVAAICACTALSGCWGGDDDDQPSATSQVPDSASQSVAGFIGYLQVLVVAQADTLEPVDTSAVTPPTDETVEPTVVD